MAELYETSISDLPEEILFYIFSYLGERDKAIFNQVCHHWCRIANDQLHWNRHLLGEVGIWNISKFDSSEDFCGRTNGSQIKAAVWDPLFVSKTIFTMCSPKILAKKRRKQFMKERQDQASLIFRVKSFVLKSSKEETVPKFVMFGPGLETPGISGIARKILKGQSSLFQAVKLISGGTIAVKYERQLVHMTLLYSNTKALRQPLPAQERLKSSKLFAKVSDAWVPTDPVKVACVGASCIVYVIDATSEIENIDDPFPDLTLIIQQTLLQYQKCEATEDNTSGHSLGLIVLACVPDENSPMPDWQQLLHGLNLWKYNIPWQVSLIIASNLTNISLPFDWALSRIKHLQAL